MRPISSRMAWPDANVTYRDPAAFFPEASLRFDELVDHLCRVLHGSRSTPVLLRAAVESTNIQPGDVVSREDAVGSWLGVRLIGALLDTPEHMSR